MICRDLHLSNLFYHLLSPVSSFVQVKFETQVISHLQVHGNKKVMTTFRKQATNVDHSYCLLTMGTRNLHFWGVISPISLGLKTCSVHVSLAQRQDKPIQSPTSQMGANSYSVQPSAEMSSLGPSKVLLPVGPHKIFGSCFQLFLIFTRIPGEMIQLDEHVSKGLVQPPPRVGL